MTKVTVLGLEPKKEKKLKPIEFLAYLMRASIDFNKTISKSRKSIKFIRRFCY